MTELSDERAQNGEGAFRDIVDVQVMDESLLFVARMTRVPDEDSAEVTVVALERSEPVVETSETIAPGVDTWEDAEAGPLHLTVDEPLTRWSLTVRTDTAEIALGLRALTAPLDLADPGTAAVGRAGGINRYSQLCEVRGTATFGGRSRTIEALAPRTHRWGPVTAMGRARFLTAASIEGTLLTVAALLPPGATAHGEELVGAQTISAAANGALPGPLPFETVRLSTVFDDQGLPVKAGAELFRPGEELPSRLAGTALVAAGEPSDQPGTSLTLFRFALDGVPAFGAYEIEAGR